MRFKITTTRTGWLKNHIFQRQYFTISELIPNTNISGPEEHFIFFPF